jgi:uncharacterized protein (DUF58 family)
VTGRGAALLAVVLALLLAALAARRAEPAWMAAPLLTALAAAVARAPDAAGLRLTAARRVQRQPGGEVEVTVTVRHAGATPLLLRLEDAVPAGAPLAAGAAAGRWALRPGEDAELRYTLRPTRGRLVWSGVRATASDPLELLAAAVVLAAPGELQVLPEGPRLRPLPLRPVRTLPSPGSIPARVGGSGTEFHGVREYQVGDALRWLDWRRMARHPGQAFTKEFEQEQIADVGVVLDGRGLAQLAEGGGEGGRVEDAGVFEHAVQAAAALAVACLRQGNRVSLLVLGAAEGRVYPGAGRVQLRRIQACLAEARPSAFGPAQAAGPSLARLFPAGAIVFAVTALAADATSLLLRLRSGGRQVVVVSPDLVELGAPARGEGEVGALALRAARVERQLRLRAIAQLRMPVVDWKVDQALDPLVRAALRPARGGRP